MIAVDLFKNPNLSSLRFFVPRPRPLRRRKISSLSPFLPRRVLGNLKFGRFGRPGFHRNPKFQVYTENDGFGGLEVSSDDASEMGDSFCLVDLIATRTLPPALTYMHAVERMRAAIEELKADPPDSRSGVLRFQVALPPSTKALNWLCHQHDCLVAFPQFYLLRKEIHEPFLKLDGMLGVSGIGAAVRFRGSSSILKGCNLIARYLSIDSPLIRAYGFVGINCSKDSSMIEDMPGSFYFFIPQIELNEFESCSLLASTLVWDDTLSYTFEKAIHSFELYLHQIIHNGPLIIAYCQDIWMSDIGEQSCLMEAKELQMVYLNAEILSKKGVDANCSQQDEPPVSYQSYFRHSAAVSFSTNMFIGSCVTSYSIKECANINLVWASLIVEECVRLGLTYFCIAPGSRSSPLAISACDHSLTTCVSCFDERSLAFHAVGYGRGSHKPAVVITSSGTAVSNLLPAVVEASHDFVPLLLLTADRPPELLDVGANQAIDQVNHFGKFVRFFFSLPPPTDQVPARMVLTTIDSAAYSATRAPYGPVHINCPFREPLEDFPREWTFSCLRGLDLWMSKSEPFTKYIRMQQVSPCNYFHGQLAEVLEVIQCANQGLLLIGAIHTEDEMWAALHLSKHLSWPVVTDVLSGLRLRRIFTSYPDIDEHFLFIDHLDQALLSDSVKSWAQPDVVVQIGSRITSKRLGQLLESCSPCSYILVDNHPFRHDPSHIVTYRIQSTITEFADILLMSCFPRTAIKWGSFLKALDMMVAHEISFQIHSEGLLSEPYVAHVIGEVLNGDSALFVGNSMVIRDVDMYGSGWDRSISDNDILTSNWDIQFQGMRVAGNRGASGIDGLLSTAIGFAVGCKKRVLCLIGDISFLHDTNGLALLNQRTTRKPMTILVINNHGGAIFSLLPIANRARPDVLHQFFYTSHDISVSKLCAAHSVKHLLVRTKNELQHALRTSQQEQTDCIIEVESCIGDNVDFHRAISKAACQVADHAMSILLGLPLSEDVHDGIFTSKIHRMEYSLYRIELCAPPTSSHLKTDSGRFFREGFILSISLDDKNVGFGEVAPIEIHKEDLLDVEEQLRFLLHKMEGSEISYLLPSLKGSFSHWIWRSLGIPPSSIFPSVRCGIEMAVLNALAARQGSSLYNVISGFRNLSRDTRSIVNDLTIKSSAKIQICALVDCNGTPKDVAHIVSGLVDEGFTTIKLKVARRENPIEDASVIQEIRQMVGYQINIRVDANQRWTYEQAVQFGSSVKNFNLQYIEEPVHLEDDVIKFCEESSLPVALDETIDNLKGDILHKLKEFIHPRIVAVVIKPSAVGGFENAALIAKWAQLHEKMAVISSAFESSLSLSAYIQFAHYLEQQNATICKIKNRELKAVIAHGLGTYRWLKEDVTTKELKVCVPPNGDTMEASVEDANNFLRDFQFNQEKIQRIYTGEQVRSYRLAVDGEDFSWSFKLQEVGANNDKRVIIFLHGLLGTSQDWIPIMKAVSTTARCISIDLPGHGESKVQWHMNKRSEKRSDPSIESVAHVLLELICDITTRGVVLVGYSMGARIALYMAMKFNDKIDRAVIISGSPGLRNEQSRRFRRAQDEARARYLLSYGLECFLETWYAGKLWKSLRDHPQFKKVIKSRANHHDIHGLAKALTDFSVGRQMPLWEDLKHCKKPLLFIVGEKDTKFRDIAQQMCTEVGTSSEGDGCGNGERLCEMIVVPDCGHTVHLENPLPVINAVRKFILKSDN